MSVGIYSLAKKLCDLFPTSRRIRLHNIEINLLRVCVCVGAVVQRRQSTSKTRSRTHRYTHTHTGQRSSVPTEEVGQISHSGHFTYKSVNHSPIAIPGRTVVLKRSVMRRSRSNMAILCWWGIISCRVPLRFKVGKVRLPLSQQGFPRKGGVC